MAGPSARKNFRTSASSCGQRSAGKRAGPGRVAGDQQEFEDTGHQHAPGRGMAGGRKKSRQRERDHEREIEQDRRGGGGGEALQRIEDAAIERDQRDQQQIGKRDAREIDCERETLRIAREARRQHIDHRRREQQGHRQQHDLACQQQRENAIGEQPGALDPSCSRMRA